MSKVALPRNLSTCLIEAWDAYRETMMRILVGILLMIVGFVLLFGVIVIPVLPPTQDDANINNYLQALLCKPGEKLIRDQYHRSDSRGTSYSMTPYCVNSERQREDVSGRWTLIGVGGFLVPFLVGLALTIIGANSATKARIQAARDSISTFNTGFSNTGFGDSSGFTVIDARGRAGKQIEFHDGVLKVNGTEIKMDGFTPEKLQALKSQMQANSGAGNLTAKLHQLQEAKDNGLISNDEYDRLRQKILDDVT